MYFFCGASVHGEMCCVVDSCDVTYAYSNDHCLYYIFCCLGGTEYFPFNWLFFTAGMTHDYILYYTLHTYLYSIIFIHYNCLWIIVHYYSFDAPFPSEFQLLRVQSIWLLLANNYVRNIFECWKELGSLDIRSLLNLNKKGWKRLKIIYKGEKTFTYIQEVQKWRPQQI